MNTADKLSLPETSAAPPAKCVRAKVRRTQILDAAEHCFRAHGFHGTSIADIARQARMSGGHIYHYFENKEAIINAIVQRDLERLVMVWAELRASRDVAKAMVDLSAEGVKDTMDASWAGLQIEIAAESTRNPEVARIMRAADCCCMASLAETLRLVRQVNGKHDDEETLGMMVEIIAAMFEGLMMRVIRNPMINRDNMILTVQRVMRRIIDSPDWEGLDEHSRNATSDSLPS
ncbi:MAG: TetR/AcrR family transcriptional regulator [Azoarcus sp.]|jgi:AcrR family transcriptional regulator|nr:TetR/AcrR family transcriptional regulator [Azoarcus sp.]